MLIFSVLDRSSANRPNRYEPFAKPGDDYYVLRKEIFYFWTTNDPCSGPV